MHFVEVGVKDRDIGRKRKREKYGDKAYEIKNLERDVVSRVLADKVLCGRRSRWRREEG